MIKRIKRCVGAMLTFVALQACSQSWALEQSQSASSPARGDIDATDVHRRVQALAQRTRKQLVFVAGGTFEMGDWGDEKGLPYDGFSEGNSRPVHKVTLSAFSIMAYKVTYEDFDLFTDAVGEQRIDQSTYNLKFRKPHKPAGVNWYGAKAYCEWLGKQTALPMRLATEAQWEYAARSGGKKVLFATDNGNIDKDKNFPWEPQDSATPEVGAFPPNPLGLYGMADYQASEWVEDWYDPTYYQRSPVMNPKGPDAGKAVQSDSHPEFGPAKVIRGNSSPGTNPAATGFVFSRGAAEPREMRSQRRAKIGGFSGWPSNQFRCVINEDKPPR